MCDGMVLLQLMLGWTDKSISLIRQICLANASEKGGIIVVLAEAEKEELEAELTSHLPPEELRGSKVIFRTGTPLLSVDLIKVAAHRARSIIIMANSSGDADRSDAAVLRTVLSLKTLPDVRSSYQPILYLCYLNWLTLVIDSFQLTGHIVAELRDIDNEPLVRLVGGTDVEILVSHDVIGRLVLMAARSPGLAHVFSCMLGFEGNEFYFKEWPECVGVAFRDLCERFPDATPLGIKRASGEVLIFPDFGTVVQKGDQIMVLAEDDDTYKACAPANINVGKLPNSPPKTDRKEKILMCGWRRDIRDMIQLLDCLVGRGTELHMICEEPPHIRTKLLKESGLNIDQLQNLSLIHHFGNTAIRRHVGKLPLQSFTSVMILADQSRETDIMNSDSHSLASLLLIRDLQAKSSPISEAVIDWTKECKCISEILDPRTQRTISTSSIILQLSEFIQSNELISCILAMISESRDVRVILDELLGPHGAYFEVETSTRYCNPSEQVSFWQLAKRAMQLGEILCGYQVRGDISETVLNPADKAKLRKWYNVDMIVLRSKNDNVFSNKQAKPVPVDDAASNFERTAQSRLGKSSFVRQQMLEALVQEQELASIENITSADQKNLSRAVQSFVEITHHESALSNAVGDDRVVLNAKAVKSLISIARILADALEKSDATRLNGSGGGSRRGSDIGGEPVTEFDMNSSL